MLYMNAYMRVFVGVHTFKLWLYSRI